MMVVRLLSFWDGKGYVKLEGCMVLDYGNPKVEIRNYVHLQAGPLADCYKYGFGALLKSFSMAL